jgi:hypothetical protein
VSEKASKSTAAPPFGSGFGSGFGDSLELMKKMWGMTGLPIMPSLPNMAQFTPNIPQALPSMIAPTLDIEELDRRIADLRAVEQWLNLNVNMLRATIQSIEVQRNTIATLKSFSGVMLGTATAPTPAPSPLVHPPSPAAAAPPTVSSPERPRARKRKAASAESSNAAALPLNPAAWWGALQDQFNKVAAAAVESTTTHSAADKPKRAGKSHSK